MFKKVVLQQLVDYLSHSNHLCTSQSAYRPHHSTEKLLLKTANDILLSLDKRDVSSLPLLDLSSAFYTIDHNILFDWLHYLYGISGTCLSWFRSYLSNRRQSVAIASRISSTKELHYGFRRALSKGLFVRSLHTTIDYLIETTCINICALLCFKHVNLMCMFIVMSISVRRHEIWCTVRDMRLSKCSIIIIISNLIK